MGIISWIVFGLIAGIIAKLLLPGRDPGGCIITMLLGIIGAFVGGFIFKLLIGRPDITRFGLNRQRRATGSSMTPAARRTTWRQPKPVIETRTDTVESLLRPPELKAARERYAADEIFAAEFKRIEDGAVDEAARLQEEAGLEVGTDG